MQDLLVQVEHAIAALENEKILEQNTVRKIPEQAVTYGEFVKQAVQRGRQLAKDRDVAEAAVRAARDKLTELFEEQKRYEIAEADRLAAAEREERRRETAELDEMGGVSHARKKKDNL